MIGSLSSTCVTANEWNVPRTNSAKTMVGVVGEQKLQTNADRDFFLLMWLHVFELPHKGNTPGTGNPLSFPRNSGGDGK